MQHRRRGETRTASVESRSDTISRLRGSPISSSGSPAGTTARSPVAASAPRRRRARRRRPCAPPALDGLQPRARELQLVLGPRDRELGGAHAPPRRVLQRRLRGFELVAARSRPPSASVSSRASRRLRARPARRPRAALGRACRPRRAPPRPRLRARPACAGRGAARPQASAARRRSCRGPPVARLELDALSGPPPAPTRRSARARASRPPRRSSPASGRARRAATSTSVALGPQRDARG